VRGCLFTGNDATVSLARGGAIHVIHVDKDLATQKNSMTGPHIRIEGCDFDGNKAGKGGGALSLLSNEVVCEVINSRFFENEASEASAIAAQGEDNDLTGELLLVNCSLALNDSTGSTTEGFAAVDLRKITSAAVENCVLAQNTNAETDAARGSDLWLLADHVLRRTIAVRTRLDDGFGNAPFPTTPGNYNWFELGLDSMAMADADGPAAGFVDVLVGNLRLVAASVGIDGGSNFVDTNLTLGGTQLLGPFDFAGATRIVDGDGNGTAVVDMGAYEYKP